MKIAIDISQVAYKGSGVSRYTNNLIQTLIEYDKVNEYTFFYSSLRIPFSQSLANTISQQHHLKTYKFPPLFLSFLWNNLHIIPFEMFVGKQDIIVTSDWLEPPARAKKVTVLHDLIFFVHPETFVGSSFNAKNGIYTADIVKNQMQRLAWVKKDNTFVICDSRSTESDASKFLHLKNDHMNVIYPCINLLLSSEIAKRETIKKYNIKKPFILTVGKIEPRKNIPRLIDAFRKAKIKNMELLIVGRLGWEEKEIMKNSENIRFLGFLEDHELSTLYTQALFFIYPSLYEGFGLPIAEAMAAGCPTATSNTSSLREIGENTSYLFDPHVTESIVHAILTLSNDKKLRDSLIERGYKKAEEFSGLQFAKKWMHVFETLMG